MGIVKKNGTLNQYAAALIQKKARSLVGRYGFTDADVEDIEQDLWLDLLKRESRFDPERGAETTFIAMIIDNRVATIVEHQSAEKRGYETVVQSLDDKIDCGDEPGILRHEVVNQDTYLVESWEAAWIEADRRHRRAEIDRAIEALPAKLQEIARLLETVSITDAARITGIPRTTVNEMRNAIRKEFKKRGIDDWLK